MRVGGCHAPAALPQERDVVPIIYEVTWAPVTFWTGAENFVPTKIRSPKSSVLSDSLYQLHYPGQRSTILQHSNPICSEIYLLSFEPCLCRSVLVEICLLWNIFMFKCLQFSVMEKPWMLNVNPDRCHVCVIVRRCAVGWVLPDVSKNRRVIIFRDSSILRLLKWRHGVASQNIWTLSNTALEIPNPAYSTIISCTNLKYDQFVSIIKDYFLNTYWKMYLRSQVFLIPVLE
jgi:hypothetical protein